MMNSAANRSMPIRAPGRGRFFAYALLAGCALAMAGGCEGHARSAAAEHATGAAGREFQQLFQAHCAGCHGAEGKLGPAPPLNDPLLLAIVPDETLLHTIEHGRPGTPMPGFGRAAGGPLTDADLHNLAQGLKQHWKAAADLPIDFPPYAFAGEVPQGSDAVAAGERLFARSCATCHGSAGHGMSDGKPPNALRDPAFLALTSDQALRRIIITGRPDLGMPDCRDKSGRPDDFQPLTSQEVEQLVALLAHWRTAGAAPSTESPTEPKP